MARVHCDDTHSRLVVEKILCNGFQQPHTVWADEELGAVERLKVDKDGNFLEINGEVCREEIFGIVQITFKKHWSMNTKGEYVYTCNGRTKVYPKVKK